MKLKKLSVLIMALSLVISASALVGCAPKGGDDGGINEKPDPTRTQITVAIKNDSVEKKILTKLKTAFEAENSDVQIIIKASLGADYTKAIFNYSSTEFPDMIWASGDVHQPVSAAGKFQNLKEYFDRDFPDWETEFSDTSMRSTHYSYDDDGIWFAPRDYNSLVIMYNKDIFANAISYDSTIKMPNDPSYYEGGKTGWTWEEFEETLRKFRVLIEDNNAKGYGLTRTSYPLVGQLNWNPVYYTLVKGFGGEIIDGITVKLDDSATRTALEKIRALGVDKLSTDASSAFTNKLAAMSVAVRTTVGGALASGLNVDVVPFPTIGDASSFKVGAGCSGYAMSASSEHKDEVWRFLKFMLSLEGQEIIGETQSIVPVRMELFDKADASWRTSTPNINNDAFVSDYESALHLNFADHVAPNNQGAVYQDVTDFFYWLPQAKYSGDSGLNELISIYKTKLQNSINGLS